MLLRPCYWAFPMGKTNFLEAEVLLITTAQEPSRRIRRHHVIETIQTVVGIALLAFVLSQADAFGATRPSPTGGALYPSFTGGADAPAILQDAIFDRPGFRLFGVHGHFTLVQAGRRVWFWTSAHGQTTKAITQLRYDLKLSRKPLHAKKGASWKVWRQRHKLVGFEGGATALNLFYLNHWALPKHKRAYRYLLKVKLSFTAEASPTSKGHTRTRYFVRELLPV